jgi:transposase InsO family protein
LRKTNYVALVKPESKWQTLIQIKVKCQLIDLWNYFTWIFFGPTSFVSTSGNSYCLVIVDDYSRLTWVYFLRDKSNIFETFKSFAILAQNQFEFDIKKVRNGNGLELKNARIDEYCDDKGIKHEFSSKYTPKQNGIVERMNRTLIDIARSMLAEYNVPDSYWVEAINTCHTRF